MLAAVLGPSPALAQSETDKLSAQESLQEANELRGRGEIVRALAKYKAAYGFAATPITGYELGRAEADAGQLVEAYNTLRGVERLPPRPGESALGREARARASALADAVRSRIPELTIEVRGAPPGAPVTVTLDGVALHADTLSSPRRVNPGKHVLVAQADGAGEARVTIDLAEGGGTREATLDLSGRPAPPTSTPSATAPAEAPPARPRSLLARGPAAAPAIVVELGGIVGTSSGLGQSLSFIPGELVLGATFRWFELEALGVLGSVDLSKGATFGGVAGRAAARLPLDRVAFALGGTFGYFDATTSGSISPGPWVSASLGFEAFPVCHWIIDVHADGGVIGDTGTGSAAGRALFALSLGYRAGPCQPR